MVSWAIKFEPPALDKAPIGFGSLARPAAERTIDLDLEAPISISIAISSHSISSRAAIRPIARSDCARLWAPHVCRRKGINEDENQPANMCAPPLCVAGFSAQLNGSRAPANHCGARTTIEPRRGSPDGAASRALTERRSINQRLLSQRQVSQDCAPSARSGVGFYYSSDSFIARPAAAAAASDAHTRVGASQAELGGRNRALDRPELGWRRRLEQSRK